MFTKSQTIAIATVSALGGMFIGYKKGKRDIVVKLHYEITKKVPEEEEGS